MPEFGVQPVFDQAASDARGLAALAALDETFERLPACRLCGQRVNKLDEYGLCSRISDSHKAARK
jgi:hypothetical protein